MVRIRAWNDCSGSDSSIIFIVKQICQRVLLARNVRTFFLQAGGVH